MTDSVGQPIICIVKTLGSRNGESHFAERNLAVEVVVNSIINLGASVEDMVRGLELTTAQVHAVYVVKTLDMFVGQLVELLKWLHRCMNLSRLKL